MKIVSLTCPKCGGKLDDIKIADGKSDLFCNYCGNHILLENENYKVVEHRTVDEAKLRQLEFEREKYERESKFKKYRIITGSVLVAAGVISMVLYYSTQMSSLALLVAGVLMLALGSSCFPQNNSDTNSK